MNCNFADKFQLKKVKRKPGSWVRSWSRLALRLDLISRSVIFFPHEVSILKQNWGFRRSVVKYHLLSRGWLEPSVFLIFSTSKVTLSELRPIHDICSSLRETECCNLFLNSHVSRAYFGKLLGRYQEWSLSINQSKTIMLTSIWSLRRIIHSRNAKLVVAVRVEDCASYDIALNIAREEFKVFPSKLSCTLTQFFRHSVYLKEP
jgi:hypothetical protein